MWGRELAREGKVFAVRQIALVEVSVLVELEELAGLGHML